MLERLENTFDTFDKLERRHGHFCNWYDTQTAQPLPPLYLSQSIVAICWPVCSCSARPCKKKEHAARERHDGRGLEDAAGPIVQALFGTGAEKESVASKKPSRASETAIKQLTLHLRKRPQTLGAGTTAGSRETDSLAAAIPGLVEELGQKSRSCRGTIRWTSISRIN